MDEKTPLNIIYFWNIHDKVFKDHYEKDANNIFKHHKFTSVDKIAKEDRLAIAFTFWVWYLQLWEEVLIVYENDVDAKKYYPKNWKLWDPIPVETSTRLTAAKLWLRYEDFKKIADLKRYLKPNQQSKWKKTCSKSLTLSQIVNEIKE